MATDVAAAVIRAVAAATGQPSERIRPQHTFTGDLGVDSLKAVEILEEVSRRLGVRLDEEDLVGVDTVGALISLVEDLA